MTTNENDTHAAHTVVLACVVWAESHDAAVKYVRNHLERQHQTADETGDAHLRYFAEESWLPNDCPNSEWRIEWKPAEKSGEKRDSVADVLARYGYRINDDGRAVPQ